LESSNPFSRRLKVARWEKGITQQELGIRIGLDVGAANSRMNHYENGRHAPDFETAKKIAAELDVPVTYFYCESDEIAEMLLSFHKLSKEQQQLVLDFIRVQKELADQ
jgi:transcriptional regulator with XRE-family HTH domain